MELICTNGKRDSGTKFTSPEFCLPFAQTANRPVCPCKRQTINSYWLHFQYPSLPSSHAVFSRNFSPCVFPTILEHGTDYEKRVWKKPDVSKVLETYVKLHVHFFRNISNYRRQRSTLEMSVFFLQIFFTCILITKKSFHC